MAQQKTLSSMSQQMTPEETVQYLETIQANGTSILNSKQPAVSKWKRVVRFFIPAILILGALITSGILYFHETTISWHRGEDRNWYLILAPIILITLIGLSLICKRYSWAGLRGKTLWNWMSLLIIPIFIAGGGIWFNNRQEHSNQAIAYTQRQDDIYKTYIDNVSDYLIKNDLRSSIQGDNINNIAQAQTFLAVKRLDGEHNGQLLNFLHGVGLIRKENTVISLQDAYLYYTDLGGYLGRSDNLSGADLNGSDLSYADLSGANLKNTVFAPYGLCDWPNEVPSGTTVTRQCSNPHDSQLIGYHKTLLFHAYLSGADLSGANLVDAYLSDADLSNTNLSNTDLENTDLSGTNLHGAILDGADLHGAKYSTKPIRIIDELGNSVPMPPTQWPKGFNLRAAGVTCGDCTKP